MRVTQVIFAVFSMAATQAPLTAFADNCSTPDLFAGAIALESNHQFEDAYKRLQPCESSQGLDQPERQHLANLRALVSSDSSPDPHVQFASERANILRQVIARLDPVRDAYLLSYAWELLDRLDTAGRSFRASGFAQVLWHVWTSIAHCHWLDVPAIVAIALLLLALILCPLLVLGSQRYEISFEDLTTQSAGLKGAPGKQSADNNLKELLDRSLVQDLQQAFWVPRIDSPDAAMDDMHIDAIKDHDGSSFGSLVPQTALMPWADLVRDNDQVQVASFKLSLRPLWLLLSSFFRQRSLKLVGYLHNQDKQTILTAQLLKQQYKTKPLRSWNVIAETEPGRHDVIRNLAAQILVDLDLSKVTTNWRSYRCFVEGHEHIALGGGSIGSCESATTHFRKALEYDPANWMARFYLAIALRRRGEHQQAIEHLNILDNLFKTVEECLNERWWQWVHWKAWLEWKGWLDWRGWWYRKGWLRATGWTRWRRTSFLQEHTRRYPHCAFLVLYNQAMALIKAGTSDDLNRAIKLLDQVLDAAGNSRENWTRSGFPFSASMLSREDRQRFRRLALCGQATIWAAHCEAGYESLGGGPLFISLIEKVADELTGAGGGLQDTPGDRQGCQYHAGFVPTRKARLSQSTLTSFHLAQAVTWNAWGVAHQSLGQAEDALRCFTTAATILPDLVDSFINTASLYIRNHRLAEAWSEKARQSLLAAMQLDDHNPKAGYWLARLEMEEDDPLKHDKIVRALADAQGLPEACFLMAEFRADSIDVSTQNWSRGLAGLSYLTLEQEISLEGIWRAIRRHAGDPRIQAQVCRTVAVVARLGAHKDVQLRWRSRVQHSSGAAA